MSYNIFRIIIEKSLDFENEENYRDLSLPIGS